jgi:hypothetical protein
MHYHFVALKMRICPKIIHAQNSAFAGRIKLSVSQAEDPIQPVENLIVMRYDDNCRLLLDRDLPQKIHDDPCTLGIQSGGGLIGKHQLGVVGKSPGDGNALRLPSREPCRIGVLSVSYLKVVEKLDRSRPCRRIRLTGELENEGHIFQGGEKGYEVVKTEAFPAPPG